MISKFLAIVAILLSLIGVSACGDNAPDNQIDENKPTSFIDKTVNIIIFTGPGAPPDIWFRTLGPFLQKHLPGNPQINFINKPGAGSMIAANYLAQAVKADGFTVGTMNAVAMDKAASGNSSARFDLRSMRTIGALRKTRIIGTNVQGIDSFDALMNSGKELILGTEADATPYYESFYRLTGLKLRILSSYTNGVQTMAAFRTKEIDAMPISSIEWVTISDSVEQEGGAALWQVGYVNSDNQVEAIDYVDVPTGHDIVRRLNPDAVGGTDWDIMTAAAAGQTISDEVWAPSGTPDEYVAIWRQAFSDAVNDPEFVQQHIASYGTPPIWTNGAQARTIVDGILSIYEPKQ